VGEYNTEERATENVRRQGDIIQFRAPGCVEVWVVLIIIKSNMVFVYAGNRKGYWTDVHACAVLGVQYIRIE